MAVAGCRLSATEGYRLRYGLDLCNSEKAAPLSNIRGLLSSISHRPRSPAVGSTHAVFSLLSPPCLLPCGRTPSPIRAVFSTRSTSRPPTRRHDLFATFFRNEPLSHISLDIVILEIKLALFIYLCSYIARVAKLSAGTLKKCIT